MEYTVSTGRRKKSIARAYLAPGSGKIEVNKKDFKDYFKFSNLQIIVNQPFVVTDTKDQFDVKINVKGGGTTGQAEAVRHAISRALVEVNPEHKPLLKEEGFMTRDPRMVERKKPGLKKARKKTQFRKR